MSSDGPAHTPQSEAYLIQPDKGPKFYGRRALKEDPVEYLDTIRILSGGDDTRSQLYIRYGLQGPAKAWYLDLPRDIRQNWETFQQRFLEEYDRERNLRPEDVLELSSQIAALKQDETPIKEYVKHATRLNAQCPTNLQQELARRFLAGITDTDLIRRAQTQIADLSHFRFDEARTAVIQQFRVFGRTSVFDHREDEEDNLNYRLRRHSND
ncbi:MAG: hypothetical protein M1826_004937 [Phylliscum demangeonii]|nr:MAG: hypothetical protein M1826_004937 [Phylliscum demangeonii]